MDIPHLLVQILIAVVCAGAATVLIPRRVPGKLAGMFLIGLAGVWFGEWGFAAIYRTFGITHKFLHLQFQGVVIVPAIIGSAIILYVVTAFLKWARYV